MRGREAVSKRLRESERGRAIARVVSNDVSKQV